MTTKDKIHSILSLIESAGLVRSNEFIRIGIPLPSGQFHDAEDIRISDGKQILPSERKPTIYWPDGSIKWCLLGFYILLDKYEEKNIFLSTAQTASRPKNQDPPIKDGTDSIQVKTKNYDFQLSKRHFCFFKRITRKDTVVAENGFCSLLTGDDESLEAVIDEFDCRTVHGEQYPLYSEVVMAGRFHNSNGPMAFNFETRLEFFFESDRVDCSMTLHNPNRARHPSGLWDLGDINSLYIKDFSLGFDVNDKQEIRWKAEPGQDWELLKGNTVDIYQESSGGEHWDSPNHKNRYNRVPMQYKGYRCKCDNYTQTGNRASPMIGIDYKNFSINVGIEKFWQNFPKSLRANGNRIELNLLPEQFPDLIELQPGEKKTHHFFIDLSGHLDKAALTENPIHISLNQEWINRCQVLPFELVKDEQDPIGKIIQEGIMGPDSFFAKREIIDEYGWRNFGDIYADHEADLYKGEDIFISHYNNQYDPLYGFLIQYLLTGDNKWFELANDLARHITDIDIYHTDEDRDEYNGGAFWHTDHYLDAKTSSHRSYSQFHEYVYEGHAGGGGPGGEHCYTTGLYYHYLLTGCEASKQAVLELSNWITHFYEGSGTFFDLLVSLRNAKEDGFKNILTGKYSLDRGTGYYVNALLDKFLLTNDKTVLQQAEKVINNTVHPLDDIDKRDLGDIERRWFYTIFLQNVCRYMTIKEDLFELDDEYHHAKDALLHYALWMVKNEYPYLEKPDVLEFPNHTWTAQDFRKVNILVFAADYVDEQKQTYLEKASQLHNYIVENLSIEPTRTYCRILVILMQNHIPLRSRFQLTTQNTAGQTKQYLSPESISIYLVAKNLMSNLFGVLRHFSIKNEICWFNKRTQIFSRFNSKQ